MMNQNGFQVIHWGIHSYFILDIFVGVEWTRLEQWTITGHSLKTVAAVTSPDDCQSFCLVTPGCLSINYDQRGDIECTLNNCTRLDAGAGYIMSASTDYYEYYFTPLGKSL